MKIQLLTDCLSNLVVFDALRRDPLISALTALYSHRPGEGNAAYGAMCDVSRALYPYGDDLTARVFSIVCRDDNPLIKKLAAREPARSGKF